MHVRAQAQSKNYYSRYSKVVFALAVTFSALYDIYKTRWSAAFLIASGGTCLSLV